eukprot:TRINITY_DN3250_c4_g6_i1.p1 TRINITY_DN3250_c4_g6~~TRINITY_DN3250_c4_g6_i1.p1  ORF type:complete len:442 (+),score=156.22 TRINITY_DN3250_c4_g6_i1:87-1412(+)
MDQKQKAEATKAFVEERIRNLMRDTASRAVRRKQFEETTENLSDEEKANRLKEFSEHETDLLRMKRVALTPNDFIHIETIGRGAFGEVSLVRYKADNELYALKLVSKKKMLKKGHITHLRAEKEIMAASECIWLTKLIASFQDDDYLYLIMEYAPGGDLMSLLIREETLEENVVKIFMAELILAIDEVHNLAFIHRDLKPDNILIDRNGHLKLTDFGLSTQGANDLQPSKLYQKLLAENNLLEDINLDDENHIDNDKVSPNDNAIQDWRSQMRALARSAVGTPDFAAPEVLLRKPYDHTVDWWALGVIMFECLYGYAPFFANTPVETCRKIVHFKKYLNLPSSPKTSPEAQHLIKSLLRGPRRRLGRNGVEEIKSHPFFEGIDWGKLGEGRGPFNVELRNELDTSNFDELLPPQEEEEDDDDESWRELSEIFFKGYDFRRK